MVTALVAHVCSSLLGTLYPAYASFKAIKNRDVPEYVRAHGLHHRPTPLPPPPVCTSPPVLGVGCRSAG